MWAQSNVSVTALIFFMMVCDGWNLGWFKGSFIIIIIIIIPSCVRLESSEQQMVCCEAGGFQSTAAGHIELDMPTTRRRLCIDPTRPTLFPAQQPQLPCLLCHEQLLPEPGQTPMEL
jgi:hypothetical protein